LSVIPSHGGVARHEVLLFGLIALSILTALYFWGGRRLTRSADHSAAARKVADVHDIAIKLEINENTFLLFTMVGADGSINRSGSGTLGDKNKDLFIGKASPAIFDSVRSHLTQEMLYGMGRRFRSENPRGALCKLTLVFQFNDGTSNANEYLYGSESEGSPTTSSILWQRQCTKLKGGINSNLVWFGTADTYQ